MGDWRRWIAWHYYNQLEVCRKLMNQKQQYEDIKNLKKAAFEKQTRGWSQGTSDFIG